jgi:hypothetical protein
MATKMEVVMTEIGIEKFEAAVTDNPTVILKSLALPEGKYRRTRYPICRRVDTSWYHVEFFPSIRQGKN